MARPEFDVGKPYKLPFFRISLFDKNDMILRVYKMEYLGMEYA